MFPKRPSPESILPSMFSSTVQSSHHRPPRTRRLHQVVHRTKMHQLSTVHLLLSLLLLNALVISTTMATEKFNIDKLLEYNSLATCIGAIAKDFETCNNKGAEKAKSFQVDLGDEWNRRLQCCGMWKLRDCWMKAARSKCSKAQAEQVFKLPHLFMPDMATSCAEFTPESGKCTIPMWLIASVVSAGIILTLSCLCGTIFCIKRLRARGRRRTALHRPHRRSAAEGRNGGTQLMPTLTMTANGTTKPLHLNGHAHKARNGTAGTHGPPAPPGWIASPTQPYMNGAAKVTINIEDGTSEEFKSLNGSGSGGAGNAV